MKKNEPPQKSLFGFIITAVLSLIVGVGIASIELAMRPVSEHTLPLGTPKTDVVYLRGGRSDGKAWDDRAKKVWRGNVGIYGFSEGDLNALINKHIDNIVGIEGIEVVQVEELPNVCFMDNGQVQVGVVLSLPEYAGKHKFIYQVRGQVVPGGFEPDMGWIGQCPIPFFNMAILQHVRRQLDVDKDVTRLPELRRRIVFSRDGEELVVDVKPKQ